MYNTLLRARPLAQTAIQASLRALRFRAEFHRVVRRDPTVARQMLVDQFSSPSSQRAPTLQRFEQDAKVFLGWSHAEWLARLPAVQTLFSTMTTARIQHRTEHLCAYAWKPTGRARGRILLCHGWEGYALNFALLIAKALEAGFEVHAFDHLAHGASSGRKSGLPIAVDGLRVVASHLGPVDAVVGHSLGGGAVAWATAHEVVQTNRVVLLAPFFDTYRLTRLWCAFHLMGEERAEMLREGLEHDSGMTLAEFMSGELAKKMSKPTLLIHDPKDRITLFKESQNFVDTAVDARLMAATNEGHIGLLASDTSMQAVVDFCAESTKQSA
jgi:pimeloyl-ACP methyl ester carboxylesterase